MKKLSALLKACVLSILIMGCGSDDPSGPTTVALRSPLQFSLTDNGNAGNSRDLYLKFKNITDEIHVQNYNLVLVKSGSPALTVETAEALDDAQLATIDKTGFAFSKQLDQDFVDTDGDAIVNDRTYNAYLFTHSNAQEFISSLSLPIDITLKEEDYYEVKMLSTTKGEAISYHPNGYLIIPGEQNSLFKVNIQTGVSEVLDSGLPWPLGGGFDLSTNTYYAAYYSSGHVYAYTQNGDKSLLDSGFSGPIGIAVDADHNIYVGNYDGNYISKITPQGANSVFATSQGLINGPDGLVFAKGELYAINFKDSRIMKISSNGVASLFATLPGTITGYIAYQDDHFYVASISTKKIFKIDMSGNYETIAGTGESGEINGPAALAQFEAPNGIAIAGDTIFVSDASGIRMIIRHD